MFTHTEHFHAVHTSVDVRSGSHGPQQFESLLSLVDVISFDLFDTLIHRNGLFSPKDLFYRVQDEAEKKLGLFIDNLTSVRVRSEETARVRIWGRGDEDTTLDEIYTEVGRILMLDNSAIHDLKEIELDCERSALTALESGKRLYKAALAAGKTIVIVSDTYFDEGFINEIIIHAGYGDVSKVYASSSYRKTKMEGSLYDMVLKDLQCNPGSLLHIGDNQLSDVTVPLGKGIRTYYVPTSKNYLKRRCGLGDMPSGDLVVSDMMCEVSKRTAGEIREGNTMSVLQQTAIEHLSLLFYSFSSWLVEQLKEGGYTRVYFASRDGLIIKRFFEITAKAVGFDIDSKYLYVSRAALYPTLIFTDPETARGLFCHNWDHLTIEDALRRISVSLEGGENLLTDHGLGSCKLPLDGSTIPKFSAFLTRIWPLLERKHEQHYQIVIDYLKQEMLFKDEKTAFVDIGWHGSMQNCLLKLIKHTGSATDLRGLYLGTFKHPAGVSSDFKARGFLVDLAEPHVINSLIRSGPSVIEQFFGADHGSVLGYKYDGTRVLPRLEDNPVEREQFRRIIKPVQQYALDFVLEHLKRVSGVKIRAPEPEPVARMALRFIHSPTKAEAATFGLLSIASDFGAEMKSITGALEWDLKNIAGDRLPDGQFPMWRPGFHALKGL